MPVAEESLPVVDEADEIFSNGNVKSHVNGKNQVTDELESVEMGGKIFLLESLSEKQGLEITLLKSALADTITRLSSLEKELSNLKRNTSDSTPTQRSSQDAIKTPAGRRASAKSSAAAKTFRSRSASESSPSVKSSDDRISTPPHNKKVTTARSLSVELHPVTLKDFTKSAATFSGSESRGNAQDTRSDLLTEDGKPKLILAKKTNQRKSKKVSKTNSKGNSGDSPELLSKDLFTEMDAHHKVIKMKLELDQSILNESVKFHMHGRGMTFYPPTNFEESKDNGCAPEETLRLDYIYGYRGKDCRDNLFLLPSAELLYNMAGVVVMHDEKNNTQRHFIGHTDDVKCIALHPDQNTVASGQLAGHGDNGKPHVLVWNATTLEVTASFGHGIFERGLCAVEFSKPDGQYLVAIDESNEHVVSIWDWEKQIKLTETKCSKEIIFNVKWSNTDPCSFATYGKSHLGFWTFPGSEERYLSKKVAIYEKVGKPKFVLSLIYTPEGDVIAGDSNGNILLFKEGSNRVANASNCGHKGGVFALCILRHGQVISCGKDGQCVMWSKNLEKLEDLTQIDERFGPARCILTTFDNSVIIGTTKNCLLKYESTWQQQSLVMQIKIIHCKELLDMIGKHPCHEMSLYIVYGHAEEMWGLTAHPNKQIFATCSREQTVCVWNGETSKNIWTCLVEDNPQCIEIHCRKPLLMVGTKSGSMCVMNYEIKEEMLTLQVAREQIDDIKLSPDAKYIAVASRDTNIYLYTWPEDDRRFRKPNILSGHSSRILHLDWSASSEFLQSTCLAYELLYWHSESGSQVLSTIALRDLDWETWTCPIGFPVMGIWPEGADGTDINACCRSNNKKLVATGDDFGEVKLFTYPSTKLKADYRVGTGHSSHVTNVRFLKDDLSLITVGGNDCSIMQWKIIKEELNQA